SLRPQIAVTAAASLNKDAPFEPLMTITNAGLTELYNLTFSCYYLQEIVAETDIKNPQALFQNHQSGEVGNNIAPEPILKPQNSISRTCAITTKIEGIRINSVATTLRIDYRPSFWPWRRSEFRRFKSRTNT